jgi:hypothetical protein
MGPRRKSGGIVGWQREFGRKMERVVKKLHPETRFHQMAPERFGEGVFAIEDRLGDAGKRFTPFFITVTEANAEEVLATLPQMSREVFEAAI